MQIFLNFILLVSLFLTNAWILGNAPSSSDDILYGILLSIFIIFCVEVILLCFVMPNYFNSFFFWFDVIGTLTIILDIGWIANLFMPENNSNIVNQRGSILRAARVAKLGARYGRILRLVKFTKITDKLTCLHSRDSEIVPEPTLSAVRKVSARVSESLSRRVAALVMLLVIVIPFLSYQTSDSSIFAWAENFQMLGQNSSAFSGYDINNAIFKFGNYYQSYDLNAMSVSMTSPQGYFYGNFHDEHVRTQNIITYESDYYSAYAPGSSIAVPGESLYLYKLTLQMNDQVISQWNALFGILIIILLIFVLMFFTASFNAVVESLIVIPLENMMNTLRNSASEMLSAMHVIDSDAIVEDNEDELETEVLEKMVAKCEFGVSFIIYVLSI